MSGKSISGSNRKRLRAAVFAAVFTLFVILMDYPYISRLYNDHISGRVISTYEKSQESEDCALRLKKAEEYNRFLAGEGGGFLHDKSWMKEALILCPEGQDAAGWIRIPSLDLSLVLYAGTDDKSLRDGAGILEGSSLPVGGESTHTCISAHRGLPDKTLFTNLDQLENGDIVEIHTLGRTLRYEVYGHETVVPSDVRHLAIVPGRDLLTLITCTPYGINTHRLYVHAGRCADMPETVEDSGRAGSFFGRLISPVFWKMWWWVPASIMLMAFMALLVFRFA